MRSCGYNGRFPFWDWTLDSQAPERSAVWGPSAFGSLQQNQNMSQTLNATCPESQKRQIPSLHCLARDSAFPDKLGAWYSDIVIERILRHQDYTNFRVDLESLPHNQIHDAIGGDMADPASSANDPLFFLHQYHIFKLT